MDEAEDVVQEAFMKAFIWLYQFCGKSGVETWLRTIVVNTDKSVLC
jgi:DNA-directed RNA polymerase specialized sigma24 family protein